MSPNVLPDAFIVALAYALVQLGKPLILSVWPHDNPLQNNMTRAIGYALTYGLLLGNHAVQGPVLWPDLWGLLPLAGALYASSALLYHITDSGQATVPPPPPPPPTTLVMRPDYPQQSMALTVDDHGPRETVPPAVP